MKTKILSLVLLLSIMASLGIVAAPVQATTTTANLAPAVTVSNAPPAGPFDEAYVSLTGSDTTGNGLIGNPWRTITKAVNQLPYTGAAGDPPGSGVKPDRINVYATGTNNWYGFNNPGGGVAETILIDEPVVIRAYNGTNCENYKIDVTGQGINQVMEIVESNVYIIGLFITGAPVGIWAHGVDANNLIEDVEVLDCCIKVDQVENGTGIEMEFVKYPVIDGNSIKVGTEGAELDLLSVDNAWGILMDTCFQSTVTNNNIDVHGDPLATGIEMETCPKSLVEDNTIDVLAAGDNLAIGIKAKACELIDILDNEVNVETNGTTIALAFGIKVKDSDRAEVLCNDVHVQNNGVSNAYGFMLGMGIWLKCSDESKVNTNNVTTIGMGTFNDTALPQEVLGLLSEDDLADVEDINNVVTNSVGGTLSLTLGAGVVIGIKVSDSCLVEVKDNEPVDVKLAVDFVSGDIGFALGGGAGVAIGILGCEADKIQVCGNDVCVDKAVPGWQPRPDVMLYIKVHAIEALTQEFSGGGAIAVALGIALFDCELGVVSGNEAEARATVYADIQSVPKPGDIQPLAAESALALVNSQIMSAVYQSFTDTIGSEEINARISGTPPTIESTGLGGGIAAGIGILVVCSYGVEVEENEPVKGTGDIAGSTWSKESNNAQDAEAFMGGVGLGIGIAVVLSPSAEVDGNTEVAGTGTVDLDVGALHDPPVLIQSALALGGGAGVGIGILICGSPNFAGDSGEITGAALDELEVAPQGAFWSGQTKVKNNEVEACGEADKIKVKAEDQLPDHPAFAIGKGLGLAIGIAAIWSPCILIECNIVNANGNAEVCVISEAVDTFDPLSLGGAAGIGIGIASVGSWRSQIIDNEAIGQGTAKGFVMSIENAVAAPASPTVGLGGSLGLGKGILVFGSGASLVKSNGVATGLGDAKTLVFSINNVPLDDAYALALAAGIGKGIAVVCSPCTDVIECNTAAGEGTARVCSWADADFDYAFNLGVAASIDILMILWPSTNEVSEADFDAQHHGPHFGKVNYNSMVDADPLGENSHKVIVIDAGLLKIGWPCLDAQFNWWNDPTGPTGFGPGTGDGEPVFWCGKPVDYTPWLYVVHTDVLESQLGKFGFYIPLCKGLNTISTPIALEEDVVPSREWQDIVANSGLAGEINYVIRWNDATQQWMPVGPTDTLDPLDAWYIYLFDDCLNLILMVNSDDGHPYAMPSRQLLTGQYTEGWILIGPNPIFPEGCIPADDALSSIIQTPSGLPGFTQLISPVVRCQPAWYYVPDNNHAPDMLSGRGYWVWMENPDTLVGFGFSPLPDQLSKIH